jgi:hypothetical protein
MASDYQTVWIKATAEVLKRLSAEARRSLAADLRAHVDFALADGDANASGEEKKSMQQAVNYALNGFNLFAYRAKKRNPVGAIELYRKEIYEAVPWGPEGDDVCWKYAVNGILLRIREEAGKRNIRGKVVEQLCGAFHKRLCNLHDDYPGPRDNIRLSI